MSHSEITIATPNNAVDSISELSVGNIDFRKVDVGSVITLDVNLPSSYRNVDNITQVTVKFPSEGMGSKLVDDFQSEYRQPPRRNITSSLLPTDSATSKSLGTLML